MCLSYSSNKLVMQAQRSMCCRLVFLQAFKGFGREHSFPCSRKAGTAKWSRLVGEG